jgi:hypothetical protein
MTKPSKELFTAWAKLLNNWYSLGTDAAEVEKAFDDEFAQMGDDYIKTFLSDEDLDTADRESLADVIEALRAAEAADEPAMTVKQLVEALKAFPENASVLAFCSCRSLDSVVSVCENGSTVQLNLQGSL